MNKYAMISEGLVIDIVQADNPPVWPPTPDGAPVTAVVYEGDVEIGMTYDVESNTFYDSNLDVLVTSEPLTEGEERQIDILLGIEYITCLLESRII